MMIEIMAVWTPVGRLTLKAALSETDLHGSNQ